MNQNSQLPRKDGRAQPRIEEPDEENLNYEDLATNNEGMPTTGSYPEKDSPQDLDHPDINNDTDEEKPITIQFPGRDKYPITTEGDPNEEVVIEDADEQEDLMNSENETSRSDEDPEVSSQ